ncbi:FAD-binding protein [Thermopirellula anaerolimosa]
MSTTFSDQQRARVHEDLSGLVRGDVLSDPVQLQVYSGDGSIFEIRPLCIVRPRSIADVTACVQYCREHQLPIHPRGAGSGKAGESLGPGVVIDCSTHLRRVLGVEQGGQYVRVQPGIVLERLNVMLARQGRFLDCDPASALVSTVGGLIGRNPIVARGVRRTRFGRHVREITLVLDDGTRVRLGREDVAKHQATAANSRKSRLVAEAAALLRRHQDTLNRERSRAPFLGGYGAWDALQDERLDLAQLAAGAEGTLGVIVETVLETDSLPRNAAAALLLFDSLERAAITGEEILRYHPALCELLDRRHLSLARQSDSRLESLIPDQVEAAVVVEIVGESERVVRSELQELVEDVRERKKLAIGSRLAFDEPETALLRRLCNPHQSAFVRGGSTRPIPVLDDFAVPPENLPAFLASVQTELRRRGVTAALRCRLGSGIVLLHPFLDIPDRRSLESLKDLADFMASAAVRLGGGFGSSEGLGIPRTRLLRRQFPKLHLLFAEIKRTFDAGSLFNPGKVVDVDSTYDWWPHVRSPIVETATREHDENAAGACVRRPNGNPDPVGRDPIRNSADGDSVAKGSPPAVAADAATHAFPTSEQKEHAPGEELPSLLVTQLDWEPRRLIADVQKCNFCGLCRTQSSLERMCPIFRVLPTEEASPRAKVRMLHGVLSHDLPLETLTEETAKAIADLCVHCHMCRSECPAEVDVARLMSEVKAAYVAAHGISTSTWLMNRIDRWAAWASAVYPVVNWALGNRQARWLLERFCGVAHGRKLPRVYSPSFLRRAARRRLNQATRRNGPKVVYFVDTYANWFDPELAEMAVAVLEHNGVAVYVPTDQGSAGTAAIASGELDLARRLARNNAVILAEAVRQGYHVVTTEPAAAVTLTREYPQLLEDEDSRLIAKNTSDLGDYLWRLHLSGRLQLDFKPITHALGYHQPCRLRALGKGSPGAKLIQLIPGLTVVRTHEACSGMAGTYGLMRDNFRTSLRAGWGLINMLRDSALEGGATECSTCKIQMEQGTTKPTLHPVKLLAAAYGLFPGGTSRLFRPSKELTLT